MQRPPPAIVYGFLSTFHGMPRRCSTFFPNKNLILCPLRLRTSFSTSTLRAQENPNGEFNYRRNPENIRSWHQAHEPQRCYSEIPVDRATGGLESTSIKSKLKRYSGMLRDCAAEMHLGRGKVIHGHIIRSGTGPDEHLWVSLINFYAKCGELRCSRNVLEQIPVKDVVSWTVLISGFVARGCGAESLELFCEMRREDVRPNEFTLAIVLKGCSLSYDIDFGKRMHAEAVKNGLLSDVYIGSSLIDLYSKCGEMEYADDVFSMMPEKNVVLWNTLLTGHAHAGNGEAVLQLFREMEDTKMRFSNHTLSIVLKGIAGLGALGTGRAAHSVAVKVGGELDDFVRCSLLNMYSKCGMAYDATKVFKTLQNPDIVAWSSIISVVDQQGRPEDAAKLFRMLRHCGERPNEFTLSSMVSAATSLGDRRYGQSIHACAYKIGFESDNSIGNALIGMYMELGSTDGHLIFQKMVNRDLITWNTLLSGFNDDETCDGGASFFKTMLSDGLRPNMYTFISILRCCSSLLDVDFGRQVHSHIIKSNLADDGYVGTALIDMYSKCRFMNDVDTVFSRLKNTNDVFIWTALISAYSQTNQGEKVVHLFNRMRREGVVPNDFTIASCLRGCSSIASLQNGRQFHSQAIKVGLSIDMFVSTALVDMYGKCGNIDDAEILFNGSQSHDTVLWNTMICSYAHHGNGDKVLHAFTRMINDQVSPDEITFYGILSACSHMGYVEQGKKFFYLMSDSCGVTPTIEHYAILVDILSRAGKFDEAERVIDHLGPHANASIWENVLYACRSHGNFELGEKASEKLFELDPETDSNYILLSNLYASRGRWNDVGRVRALMTHIGIKKEPARSWVTFGAQVHVFLSHDSSHPRLLDIHRKLDELKHKISKAGYLANTSCVLQNVAENEKVDHLLGHSERLALSFALINDIGDKRIRIFKNVRICGDCHEFIKLVSGIVDREIVVRDASRFHHFQHGSCSCTDYW